MGVTVNHWLAGFDPQMRSKANCGWFLVRVQAKGANYIVSVTEWLRRSLQNCCMLVRIRSLTPNDITVVQSDRTACSAARKQSFKPIQ